MKKLLLFSIFSFFLVGSISAQVIGGAAITLAMSSTDAVACTPPCDGTATATPTGGTPPYTYQWSTIPMQTTQTITGLCAATYSVRVTDATTSTSNNVGYAGVTVNCNTSNSVNSILTSNEISIFPNPVHNELNIEFNTPSQGAISIFILGILGEEVFKSEFVMDGVTARKIDISFLPDGVYSIQFKSEQNLITKQFVKQ